MIIAGTDLVPKRFSENDVYSGPRICIMLSKANPMDDAVVRKVEGIPNVVESWAAVLPDS